jgi:conjugal transfer pilus assembly protein TraE
LKIYSRNKSLEQTSADNKFLLLSNTVLAVCVTVAIGALVTNKPTTVLVPPQMDRAVTVGWNNASGEYLKSFGLYVAVLAGNITPKNVNFVVDMLSTLVTPRIYTDVRKKLLAQAANPNFVKNAAATHFMPEKIIFEATTSKVFVLGTLTTEGANQSSGQELKEIYEMVIKMVDGKPIVDAITNYEGIEPHTEPYMILHGPEVRAREAKMREEATQ